MPLEVSSRVSRRSSWGKDALLLLPPRPTDHPVRRLASIESRRDFAVLFLAFVTAPGGLAVAARGTTADADTFVVGAFSVGELGEDGRRSTRLALFDVDPGNRGVEERRQRDVSGMCGWCRSSTKKVQAGRHCGNLQGRDLVRGCVRAGEPEQLEVVEARAPDLQQCLAGLARSSSRGNVSV